MCVSRYRPRLSVANEFQIKRRTGDVMVKKEEKVVKEKITLIERVVMSVL
jgi:hypothetical protein